LVLFLISFPFMMSASATYSPAAIPAASVFFSPSRITGTTGDTVNVNLTINSVTDLYTITAGCTFDHHNVQCTGLVEGPFLKSGGSTAFLPGTIDNNAGVVTFCGDGLLGALTGVSGSGILITFQFQINGTGPQPYSDVHITDWEAFDSVGNILPAQVIDYTTSVGNVVKIVGNPEGSAFSPPPYGGFSFQNFTAIDTVIDSTTYKGNWSFTIFSPDYNQPPISGFGFFNVTIPNALMSGQWYITVNGALETPIITTSATNTTISLAFTFSSMTANVHILSTEAVPEFGSTFASMLLVALLTLATFAAALLSITTRSNRRKG
jgi:hypothetical protein